MLQPLLCETLPAWHVQVLASNPRFADQVAYKLSYRVRIMAAAGVREVTCPSHDAAARVDLTASPPMVSLSEEGGRLAYLPVCSAAALGCEWTSGRVSAVLYRQKPRMVYLLQCLAIHHPSLQTAHHGHCAIAVSDASKDFTLLVELGTAAGDALRSRLTLQQAERDGGAKTTAMAVFVPRCGLGVLACCSAFMHA